MSDPRSVAVKLLGEIAVGPRDSAEFYITLIVKALADARRWVWEEAAKVADEYPQRDPAEDGNGYWAAQEIAQAIRAKAHADQEGNHEG